MNSDKSGGDDNHQEKRRGTVHFQKPKDEDEEDKSKKKKKASKVRASSTSHTSTSVPRSSIHGKGRRPGGASILSGSSSRAVSATATNSGSRGSGSRGSGSSEPGSSGGKNEEDERHRRGSPGGLFGSFTEGFTRASLDIFRPMRQRASSARPDAGRASMGANVEAPKLLIVTMESGTPEHIEHVKEKLIQRLRFNELQDDAFLILSHQVHELGPLEERLSDADKILLRKHVIRWKSALAIPHTKIPTKDTIIPIGATKDFFKPLSWCRMRFRRVEKFCCCYRCHKMNNELVKEASLQKFGLRSKSAPALTFEPHETEGNKTSETKVKQIKARKTLAVAQIRPREARSKIRSAVRRQTNFDTESPAYSSYFQSTNPKK